MIKPKLYKGQALKGIWVVTRKLDGVRALYKDGCYVSRANKPLYNLEEIKGNDLEIFCGSWEETVSRVRTKEGEPLSQECAYSLEPLDERLLVDQLENPSKEMVDEFLKEALSRGEEGLVLRQGDTWLKVKPTETFDVQVIGILPGKGKYLGKLGAFITHMGNVGTGLTDEQRISYLDYRGVIEVECMQLTPDKKFRHPRFIRVREDKIL